MQAVRRTATPARLAALPLPVKERQSGFRTGDVFRRIHPYHVVRGANDLNRGAVFQSPQLFKLLGALERSRLPADELGEEFAPVSIDSNVPKGRCALGGVAGERNAAP